MPRLDHNHITRDVKPPGLCPQCDLYWSTIRPSTPRVDNTGKLIDAPPDSEAGADDYG